MAYIAPNGNIWLCHNVPIDKTYQNTLYWENTTTGKQKQIDFFTAQNSPYMKYALTNQYYSRHEKGSIRVSYLADYLFDCNYLVFQNSSFGNGKYFFAFITSVEYINNTVSQVNFEIDVIQTWFFDFTIEPCFLERTHVLDDTIYSNLTPEPVEPGEYTYQMISQESVTSDLLIIVSLVVVDGAASSGNVYGNIYGGTTLYAFLPSDVSGLNTFLGTYAAAPETIVSIYMAPACLIDQTVEAGGLALSSSDVRTGLTQLITALPEPTTYKKFGTYTPHNNKMYSYPFCMMEVFTGEGSKAVYRYEFFKNDIVVDNVTVSVRGEPQFEYGGCVTSPVELVLVPHGYKVAGLSLSEEVLLNESISLKDYPLCSWNMDAYKAWVAQNSLPIAYGLGASMASTVGSVITAPLISQPQRIVGATASMVGQVLNIMAEDYKASIAADQLHGQAKGSANISMGKQGFFFAHKVVNEDSARRIDSFFDRFGYSVKRISPVNRKTRKYFTYVKTVGCVLAGGVPSDDEDKICALHDAGITYWNVAQVQTDNKQIGDFSLGAANSPLVG